MKKILFSVLAVCLGASPAFAQFGGGNGAMRIVSADGSKAALVGANGATPTNGLAVLAAVQGASAPGAGKIGYLNLDSSNNLTVNCATGCGATSSFSDNGAFTAGTTSINVIGGDFDDTPPTAIATGHAAAARITNNRALHTNLRNQAGTELASSTSSPGGTELGLIVRNIPSGTQAVSGSVSVSGTASTTPGSGLSTFSSAQASVTASAAALGTNTTKGVCVKALSPDSNGNPVYIGPTGVTTSTGYPLLPGDFQCWPLANTNEIFVVASTTGASVAYDWTN